MLRRGGRYSPAYPCAFFWVFVCSLLMRDTLLLLLLYMSFRRLRVVLLTVISAAFAKSVLLL